MKNYLNEMDLLIQFHKSWLKGEDVVKVTLGTFWDTVCGIFSVVTLFASQVLHQRFLLRTPKFS